MPTWLGVLRIVVAASGLVLYAGWGLTFWLAPARLRDRAFLFVPFVGLFLVDSVSELASFAGVPGRASVWIVLGLATVLNGSAARFRRGELRAPNRFELSAAACAFPALILGVAPILLKGTLLPIGENNGDPVSYSAATSFLMDAGLRTPVGKALDRPIDVPIRGILRGERLGFELFQGAVNVLSKTAPHESFSVVSAFGLFLWSLAVGLVGTILLPQSPVAALLGAALFSVSSLPLSIAYGGYGAQILGMGLLVAAFGAWVTAVEEGGRRAVALAAVLAAGLAGIYSDCLPYLLLPVLVFAAGNFLRARERERARVVSVLGVLFGGAALSVVANPVGWARTVPRVASLSLKAGNVPWLVDIRQVVGAVPFFPHVMGSLERAPARALWLVVALAFALALYGARSLTARGALIVSSFVLPHVASLVWFRVRGNTYGTYKAWSIGSYVFVVLVAAGLVALRTAREGVLARFASRAALSGIAACLAASSGVLAVYTAGRFSCTPDIVALEDWTRDIGPGDSIYVAAGSLPPVATYWIAYSLRRHSVRFSVPVLYTPYPAQPFRGERWVISYGAENGAVPERPVVVRRNDSFSLRTLVPKS